MFKSLSEYRQLVSETEAYRETVHEICFYCLEGAQCSLHPEMPKLTRFLAKRAKARENMKRLSAQPEKKQKTPQTVEMVTKPPPGPPEPIKVAIQDKPKDGDNEENKKSDDRKKRKRTRTPSVVKSTSMDVDSDGSADLEVHSQGHSNLVQEVFINLSRNAKEPPTEIGERKRYARFRSKRFVCDECDSMFTLKQNVQTHYFTYHHGPKRQMVRRGRRVRCNKCEELFQNRDMALSHHRRVHHVVIKTKPTCEICQRVFTSPSSLREHVSIQHLKELNHECDQCNQKFGRRAALRRHIMMVHEDKRFMCPYEDCEHPGYKCSKALGAHIRSQHTGERPYACDECEKRFVRQNDLRMHKNTHARAVGKALEFECSTCGATFSRSSYLKNHQRTCEHEEEEEEEF